MIEFRLGEVMNSRLSTAASANFNFGTVLKSGLILSAMLILSQQTFAADSKTAKAAPAAPAPTDASATAATPAPGSSDKLDVSDLEKKYWSAKDTDFSVVQNRAYTKAKRWAVSLMYGPVINDSYSDGFSYDLSVQYFVNERSGIELEYLKNSTKDNNAVNVFNNDYGTRPDFDRTTSYYGVNYNWVPIYAKMSLMNTKILYFDMAFSPGVGMTQYDQQRNNAASVGKSAPTISLNITQHFFLSNNFAIRGEFQNRWFNEEVISYRTPYSTLRTDFSHDTNLLFGIDYFF